MDRDRSRVDYALEIIGALQNYDDVPDVLHAIRDLYQVANLGYHALQAEGLGNADLPIIATCDPAWVQRYIAREFVEIDPVAKASRQTNLPIDWASVDRNSTETRRYFFEMSRFDIGRQGMGIPVHSPTGSAVFTFTSHVTDAEEWRCFHRENTPDLLFLAHYLHEKTISLAKGISGKALLSKQERNCLQLSAQGHNAQSIAAVLGISIHTARMHLSRAQKRLHAHSRAEAVAKALAHGLIRNQRRVIVLALTTAVLDAASLFENFFPIICLTT